MVAPTAVRLATPASTTILFQSHIPSAHPALTIASGPLTREVTWDRYVSMQRDLILRRLTARLYGSPVVRNDVRGELVEEIVAAALDREWQLCSTDWASCDLINAATGLRIQVKQSAGRQTWHKVTSAAPKPCFSIGQKSGRWEEGDRWVPEAGRNAEIFVFAWHPITTGDADHREPDQWQFFVVPERDLPAQKTISLSKVRQLTEAVPFRELGPKIRSLAQSFQ